MEIETAEPMKCGVKVATWNVNSIRARLERLTHWLEEARPDAVCLQELKCADEGFPSGELERVGYQSVWYGQKTYNGVAILARERPTEVLKGLADDVEDPQARLIAATVCGVRVLSAYVPNGQQVDSPAYHYKLEWLERLGKYLEVRHSPGDPLVLGADFNVAPAALDVYEPALFEGQILCTERERLAYRRLEGLGLVDTFRALYPSDPGFSWWDYRALGFPKNHGLRIDGILASAPLMKQCLGAGVDRDERKGKQPSDHAPVWAEFGVRSQRKCP